MQENDKKLVKREDYLESLTNNVKNYLSENFCREFNRVITKTTINFPEFIVNLYDNFDTQTFTHNKEVIELKIPKLILNSTCLINGVTYSPFYENPELKKEFVSDYDYVIDFGTKMLRKNSYFISLVHEVSEIFFYKKFYEILNNNNKINSLKENLAHGYALFFEIMFIENLIKNNGSNIFDDYDKCELKNHSLKRRNCLNKRIVEKEYYLLFNAVYEFSEKNIHNFHKNLKDFLPKFIDLLKKSDFKNTNKGNLEKRINKILKEF
ncbi:MAG: hypothetical protein QXU20_04495 [Candidatus Woesearchaeota archaeon]